MRGDAKDLRALRWRDLCEAIALSIAFHLLCALLLFAVRPHLISFPPGGDFYIRLGEQNLPLVSSSPKERPEMLVDIAPDGEIVAPFDAAPPPTYGEWMSRMPVETARTSPTSQKLDALPRGATGAIHSPHQLDSQAVFSPTWSQHLLRQLRPETLSLPGQLPRESTSEAFRLYCSSQAPKAPQVPKSAEGPDRNDLSRQLQQTLGWLRVDRARQEPKLALGGAAAPEFYWESTAANPAQSGQELANSENFSVDIKFYRRFAGRGYLFEARFRPKPEVGFQKLAQSYLFLIDRSNSISPARFAAFKKSVAEALKLLTSDDRFNIAFFDRRLTRFALESTPCTPDNLAAAQSFLDGEKSGGFFASTDLYTSLDRILPLKKADEEITSAIILTDGDTHLSRERQRRTIAEWSRKNGGNLSLFAVACGRGNNLALMELLSFFNKGRLSYCSSEAELPELVKNLLLSLHYPIGRDMQATIASSLAPSAPEILPSSGQFPNLQRAGTFSIVGVCEEPGDFYLYLQGRHRDAWLDIKQRVDSIAASEIGEPSAELERRYLVLKAFEHYSTYLQTAQNSELRAAKQLLQALGYFSAFH